MSKTSEKQIERLILHFRILQEINRFKSKGVYDLILEDISVSLTNYSTRQIAFGLSYLVSKGLLNKNADFNKEGLTTWAMATKGDDWLKNAV